MSNWQPGDPLYPAPVEVEAHEPEGVRTAPTRPMHWTADRAKPGPWPWLRADGRTIHAPTMPATPAPASRIRTLRVAA